VPAGAASQIAGAWAADAPPSVVGYEVLNLLGRGGMGVVYKARQERLNRIVALKMIRAGAYASPELRARFHIEAEALAKLQHPNIVQIYEVGESSGCPYIAMEFVDGGNLGDLLAGQVAPPRVASGLVETLARAMHAAHLRGIVHRDLKPANILLGIENGELRMKKGEPFSFLDSSFSIPKVTDFGLAKHLAEGKGHTATGIVMGTPSYMAPEQARGRIHDIGPPTDVYSLGALLYELLAGRPPFLSENGLDTVRQVLSEEPPALSSLRPKSPRDLETICLKCLEKDAAKRYQTAEHLADDLRRYLNGEPITARPARLGERVVKWTKRRPAWAALIGASVLLLCTFAWSYVRVLEERNQNQKSLQVARKAIDDLYTKMASERLFDEPQLDPLNQELLEKAQNLYEELGQTHGDNLDVRRDAALAWFRLGEIHRMRDQRGDAERAYTEAITRQEELCRIEPGESHYRRDLANSHNWLGELLRESGRPPEDAERHYRSALELQEELAALNPDDADYQMELARSHYNLGIIEQETDQAAQARKSYDRSVALLTGLRGSYPSEPNYRQDLARALINRGVLHNQGGSPDEAGKDYTQAIDMLTQLCHENPSRARFKYELAIALQNRGNILYSQGKQPEAKLEYDNALALLQELVGAFSGRLHYQKKMGTILKNKGAALVTTGKRKEAEDCWKRARDIFESLAKDSPDIADYHGLLGMTFGNLGWLRTEEKNWPEARRLIEQGIVHMQASLRPNAKRPDYRLELRNQFQDLGWTLVQLGDHVAAAQAAMNLVGVFPDRAQDSYYGACLIARCVPLTMDAQQARSYVGQAVALLQASARSASPSLKRIPDEKQVFEPLTSNPDYKAAQTELEAKVRQERE
jgi:tetratricopeptide (TPR) repeat protein